MIDQLNSYTRRLLVFCILAFFFVAVLSVCSLLVLSNFFELSITTSALITLAVSLVSSVASGYLVYSQASFGLRFLAQTILHHSSSSGAVELPNPNNLPASESFIGDLALGINSSSSAPQPTTVDNQPNLASLSIPAIAIKQDNTIAYINPAATVYFGVDAQKIVGQPAFNHIHLLFQSDKESLESWLLKTRGQVVKSSNSWDRVKSSIGPESVRQFDMVAHYTSDNPEFDVSLAFMDHTDKYAQEDNDVGFVAMAVHELRTPLTTMRGYIEVFEDELADKLNQEQATFMQNMSAQAQQLADFVGNILNVARIEENQLHLRLREEDWGQVVRKTIDEMSLRAKVRGMQIQYFPDPSLPKAGVDKVTIYEVIVNLLDNAIKYTHTDQPIIVKTHLRDERWIETTIADSGTGIPDNIMGNLFQRFYRSHHTKKTAGGTGLGLYLSKAIVNAHGGEIWVKSEVGKGSTFGFTVPIYDSIASKTDSGDNEEITREAHGWIKNHSMYRG